MVRRFAGIAAVSVAFLTATLGAAQGWSVRSSDHFDIYFQPAEAHRVADVVQEAEGAYLRVSFGLKHELKDRMPLILVRGDSDLPKTRADAASLVSASGAPGIDHLVLSVESFEGRPGVVAHELTHQFIFELLPQAWRDAIWVPEGLCDHQSGVWDPAALADIRKAISAGRIPPIESLTGDDRHWSHALFEFVEAEHGARGVERLLAFLRDGSTAGAAFGADRAEFNAAFRAYLTTRFGLR